VPEPKRRYGYYVLPLLVGDRLIARVDPKLDRKTGTLVIKKVWWERATTPTSCEKEALEVGITQYAKFIGAESIAILSGDRRSYGG